MSERCAIIDGKEDVIELICYESAKRHERTKKNNEFGLSDAAKNALRIKNLCLMRELCHHFSVFFFHR